MSDSSELPAQKTAAQKYEELNRIPIIIGMVGQLGAGKTSTLVYFSLLDAEKCLACGHSIEEPKWHVGHEPRGKDIFTTIPLSDYSKTKYPHIAAQWHLITSLGDFFLEQLELSQKQNFAPASRLCVLDEVSLLLPARASMSAFYQIVSTFPQLSRKLGLQILFAAPLMSQVETRLRSLIDLGIVVEKCFMTDGSVFFKLHEYTFNATTTAIEGEHVEEIGWEIVPEVWKCFSTTHIEPAVALDLIAQLKSALGKDTEKIGAQIVYTESINTVKEFFRTRPKTAFDYIDISRTITEMRLDEIKAIVEELADARFLQIVGEGRTRKYAYFAPDTKIEVVPSCSPNEQKILDVFEGEWLTMPQALKKAGIQNGAPLFRKLVHDGRLRTRRAWGKMHGIAVYSLA
jgi:hypothetical protein